MDFAVVDYGASNMFSLISALKKLDINVNIISSPQKLVNFSAVILPGVGNFSSAISVVEKIKEDILASAGNGVPLLGICLGLQLMCEKSEEGPGEGLNIFEGQVVKFSKDMKIPHMGWNTVLPKNNSILLDGIEERLWVYFAHSYYPKPKDNSVIKGTTGYGTGFASVMEEGQAYGTQFHPEKSGDIGKAILMNFVKCIKR
jgi:glutamine amidotransferase